MGGGGFRNYVTTSRLMKRYRTRTGFVVRKQD
jgi:hypothetical protein